jgi:hypothetical protein
MWAKHWGQAANLYGGRSVVQAAFFLEGQLAILVVEKRALDSGEGVGCAGHKLGVHKHCEHTVPTLSMAVL